MSIESPRLLYSTLSPEKGEYEPVVHDFSRQSVVGGYALQMAAKKIEESVLNASKHFPLETTTAYFNSAAQRLKFFVDGSKHLIDDVSFLYGKNIIEYFQLINAHDFAIDSSAVQTAFASYEEKELRVAIADGLAGISTAHIGLALKMYGLTKNEDRRSALRGVISEQLALTLTNLSENPDRIALPASLSEDRTQQTDMKIYHFSQKTGYVTPVQVKSSKVYDAPRRGININQHMLGYYKDQHEGIDPSRDFQLARSLVALMNADTIGEAEATLITESTKRFESRLDALLEYPNNRTPVNRIISAK